MAKQQRRQKVAQQILDSLYVALQSAERQLYTQQVPYKPRIIVTDDERINAFADSSRNTIVVFRGVFDAVEELASESSEHRATSMLAAVIGHELAHLFFKHWADRQTGVWGELSGSLRIDRNQERQADALGTRLSCAAGYDASGLEDFMRVLISRYGDGSDFGSNHPSSRERVMMIQRVARQCP